MPYPKYSDQQEWYITSTHDACGIGLIPMTVAPNDLDCSSADVDGCIRKRTVQRLCPFLMRRIQKSMA